MSNTSESDDQIIVQDIFDTISMANALYDHDPEEDIYTLIEILNDNPCDINTHYYYKPTALDDNYDNFLKTAVMYMRKDIVQLLINYGIYVNIQDTEGLTPLDILYKSPYNEEAGPLSEKGWRLFYSIESILLENGAITRIQMIIKLQRRWRRILTHRRAKQCLAFAKTNKNLIYRQKPEELDELAPDLLEKISTYMKD